MIFDNSVVRVGAAIVWLGCRCDESVGQDYQIVLFLVGTTSNLTVTLVSA